MNVIIGLYFIQSYTIKITTWFFVVCKEIIMFWKNCIQVAQNIWRLYEEKGGGKKKERKSESQKLTRDILFKKGKKCLGRREIFFLHYL